MMFSRTFVRLLNLTKSQITSFERLCWTVNVSRENRAVVLNDGENGDKLQFPIAWLRDNCRCSHCFDSFVHSRILSFKEFKAENYPRSTKLTKNSSSDFELEIIWPDDHTSLFTSAWLREHSFDEKTQRKWLMKVHCLDRITWHSGNFREVVSEFELDDILTSDSTLLKWLLALSRTGIAFVRRAGNDEHQVEKLAARVGIIKPTTYGKLYRVEAKDGAKNAAYLPSTLPLHVDLPYYQYAPNFNFLHFAQQSPNEREGVNQLVDGLHICERLKSFDSRLYNVLANTVVEWSDKSQEEDLEFYHIHRDPVICENKEGTIVRINVSQPQRDPHFCVSLKEANEWYEAMNWFVHFAHHPKNLIQLKMKEGDILTFDNLRVLHGRSAFTSKRIVVGAYMDSDIINSKIRILSSKLNIDSLSEVP